MIKNRAVVIGVLMCTLVLVACGQKSGVHVASGRLGSGGSAGNDLGGTDTGTGAAAGAAGSTAGGGAGGAGGGAGGAAAAGGTAAGGRRGAAGGSNAAAAAAAGGAGDTTGVTDNSITIGIRDLVSGIVINPATTLTIQAKVRWLRGNPEILFRLKGNYVEAAGNMLTSAPKSVPNTLGTDFGAEVSMFPAATT